MIQELRHRSKLLPAPRTAGNHYAVAALGDRRRLVNECGKVVPVEFAAKLAIQLGFEHGLSGGEGTGRQDNTIFD